MVFLDAPKGKRSRLAWTPALRSRFDTAVDSLGGLEEATPAKIKESMDTDLTLGQIKSRLQKLRLEQNALSRKSSEATRDRIFDAAGKTSALSAQLGSELSGLGNFNS